jgi:hypothetical protein
MSETEKLGKAPATRVRRSPVEGRNKLAVKGKDPNYEYRVVNDTDDRVNDLLDRGYVFETSEEVRVGDSRLIDGSTGQGKIRTLNVGGGIKALLMKIRKDWFAEDQEAKQELVKKTEAAMRSNPSEGTYGKVDLTKK